MKVGKTLTTSGLLAVLSGCASFAGQNTHGKNPYQPESRQSQATQGVVVYNPHGIEPLVERRRKDAYRKMYEFCGGTNRYEIVQEGVVSSREVGHVANAVATFGAQELVRIEFRCL